MWIHDSDEEQAIGVMPPQHPGFGQRLREAIAAAGTNPHKLAKDLRIAYTTVDAWLRDESMPRAQNIERLAEALNRPSSWLLAGDDRTSPSMPYPSLATFLEKQGALEPGERSNLLSIICDFGDPGEEYWMQALSSYRSAKRLRSMEIAALGKEPVNVNRKPRPRDYGAPKGRG